MHKLREALGERPDEPRHLITVYKRGYRLAGEVRRHARSVPAGGLSAAAPGLSASTVPRPGGDASPAATRRWLARSSLLAAGALAVVVGAVLAALVVTRREEESPFRPGAMQARRLTSTGRRELEAHFAPDGDRFVYVAADPRDGQLDLFTGRVSGGERVRLTATPADEHAPQWCPSGGRIAFVRTASAGGDGQVWIIGDDGGDERLAAASGRSPAWSPDGTALAFLRTTDRGTTELWRSTLDGAETSLIGDLPVGAASLRWSPDGRMLAATTGDRLWLAPVSGGAARPLGEPAERIRSLDWDPDGTAVLCDANWGGRANLWRVPVAGGPPQPITAGSGGSYEPSVSRDRRRVLYTQERQDARLVWCDARGHGLRELGVAGSFDCFDVDAMGQVALLRLWDAGPNQEALQVVRPASGALSTIAAASSRGYGCPALARDAATIAYAAGPERDELWLLGTGSRERRRVGIAAALSQIGVPAWSPDGRRLAVTGMLAGAGDALAVLEVNGGSVRVLATGPRRSPAWSPDGRLLACTLATVEGGLALEVVDVDSGEVRRVGPFGSFRNPPSWGDGGELVALVDERSRPTLVTVDLEGRELQRLELPLLLDAGFWGVFDARPGGGGWFFAQTSYSSDLYLLEAVDPQHQ